VTPKGVKKSKRNSKTVRDVGTRESIEKEQKRIEQEIFELKIGLTSLQQYIIGFITGLGLAIALVAFLHEIFIKRYSKRS
jgi:hypothetical protein